jgi:ADP-ribosylglycohydrolase
MESYLYNDERKQNKIKNNKEMITSQIIIKMVNSDIQKPVYVPHDEDRYVSSAVLSVIGDMIGYGNGDWKYSKFKTITWDSTLEMLFEFIEKGGINNIDMNNWKASYCSLTLLSLLSVFAQNDNIKPYNVRYIFLKMLIHHEKQNNFIVIDPRYKTKLIQTNKKLDDMYIKNIDEIDDDNYIYPTEYDKDSYDNKACPYGIAIGLALFGENKRDELIMNSLYIANTTHTSPIGYLGCLTIALFTAFAIEKKNIITWPFLLIKILSKNTFIIDFINKHSNNNNNEEDILVHYEIYLKYWNKYIDLRFHNKKPIELKSMTNVMFRSSFYSKNFGIDSNLSQEGKRYLKSVIGTTGYSAPIVAYDCLLDSKNNWASAVIYGILNIGDSSTLGSIIGGLYGAVNGFDNVPAQNLIYCPLKDSFISESFFVYKKYFKNENTNDYPLLKS